MNVQFHGGDVFETALAGGDRCVLAMARGSDWDPQQQDLPSSSSCSGEVHNMMSSDPGNQPEPSSHELRDHSLDRSQRDEPNTPKKPRACLGMLYFNQRRYDAQKAPLCGGFRKKVHENDGVGQLPTDSVPGGDFKYICIGYSSYDEEGLKRAAARRSSEADPVVLPYCEGLEIISAAALSRKPELMSAGGPGVNPPAPSSSPEPSQPGATPRQRQGRSFVPGAPEIPEGMTLEQFKQRFERMAGRMVEKMRSNASFMASHLKRTWQQVARELGGGGSGGGGDRTRD